jgi:hypothetical protein
MNGSLQSSWRMETFILDSGTMVLGTEGENNSGKMDPSTRAIGKMTWQMVWVDSFTLTVMSTRVSG